MDLISQSPTELFIFTTNALLHKDLHSSYHIVVTGMNVPHYSHPFIPSVVPHPLTLLGYNVSNDSLLYNFISCSYHMRMVSSCTCKHLHSHMPSSFFNIPSLLFFMNIPSPHSLWLHTIVIMFKISINVHKANILFIYALCKYMQPRWGAIFVLDLDLRIVDCVQIPYLYK